MNKHSRTTRFLHWSIALLVVALFFSGLYMVRLDYYHPWYNTLPELHITVGVCVLLLWLVLIIRQFLPIKKPQNLTHKRTEILLASVVKYMMLISLIVIMTCGYLMITADGQSKTLFGWLVLPAVSLFSSAQVDTMGWIHENLSYVLMVMVLVHALGALKHHFIDRDNTLKRML